MPDGLGVVVVLAFGYYIGKVVIERLTRPVHPRGCICRECRGRR